ncbi:MAG: HAD family hydrolase [Clostridiaceae bacterium]|nr:HAD family hydrolase [Clostridiaceae bacterium]
MKKYKAIFFDWDGTAVLNRRAPVDNVISKMIPLLDKGIKLFIISGTTYENIAGGSLHSLIPVNCLKNLFLGLGRGAFNLGFNDSGKLIELYTNVPDIELRLRIDKAAFEVHQYLLKHYGLKTDIVFSRPNYCKVDLMVDNDRKENLFLQSDEIGRVHDLLSRHGYTYGLAGLLELARKIGKQNDIDIIPTTDAKYLEMGITTKGDNVNYFMQHVVEKNSITSSECCFWGDEFRFLAEGVPGSDAYMITSVSSDCDFFDVSGEMSLLPNNVMGVGGSIESFHKFLEQQLNLY